MGFAAISKALLQTDRCNGGKRLAENSGENKELQSSCWKVRMSICRPGGLGSLAGEEPPQTGRLVAALGEDRFGVEIGFIQRSAGDCPLPWVDRRTEEGRKRTNVAAKVPASIGEKHLVEDESGKRSRFDRAGPNDRRGFGSNRSRQEKREMGVRL